MGVLGIDVGTTNTKVGVFDLDGSCRAARTRRTPATADDLAATVLDLVRHCVTGCVTPPDAVGVAGMAETGVPVDRGGRALTPLLWWTDQRATAEAEALNRTCGPVELYRATGRVASAKSPLATWLWLRHNEPDVLAGMAWWLGAPDLAVRALTGVPATHPTSASRTLGFRIATGDYDPDLLALAGLRVDQFPALTNFAGPAGRVDARAAAATGLPTGTPVINAGHDHSVGAWAVGARTPGTACLSLGTAEAVLLPSAGRSVLEAARRHGFTTDYTADGARTCLVGGLPTCGALLEWLLTTLGEQPDRLAALLAGVAQLPTGIVLLPYLRGRAAPAPDPSARLAMHGVAESHGPGDLLAAAVEGACLHGRWMCETGADLAQAKLDSVVLTGGLSRLDTWRRIAAALGPAPLRVGRDGDAVRVGAALRAAAATGLTDNDPTLPTEPVAVDDDLRAAYQRTYRRFRRLAEETP